MHILPRHGFARLRGTLWSWVTVVQRCLCDAARDAVARVIDIACWPWRMRSKVAPPAVPPVARAPCVLRPLLQRSLSIPVLEDGVVLEAQTLRRRHSMLPSEQPSTLHCGQALELFLSHDATTQSLNRARYVRYVGTLAREGGPPCGALEAQAAAEAFCVTLRVWNDVPGAKAIHPAAVFATAVPDAPVLDLVSRAPPTCTALQLLDGRTGTLHDVGDDGESLYACLAYAFNWDDMRRHRAAYEALCYDRGASYMSFINEFLPPRSTCLAQLRQRVAEVLRNDDRYGPRIDQAVAKAIAGADRVALVVAAAPFAASLAKRDGDSDDSVLS